MYGYGYKAEEIKSLAKQCQHKVEADGVYSVRRNKTVHRFGGNNIAECNQDKAADRGGKNIGNSAGIIGMQIKLSGKKIYLAEEAVDFRKAIDGLCALLPEELEADSIYIFYNRSRNKLKLLGWHGNGFVLLCKRLEKKKFTISKEKRLLNEEQLSWLLAGLDWETMTDWDELKYSKFY